ncbi:cupin domain-containing protein [Deinococcus ruber]|uniref:Cupin type-2 domain-containing protein n=1 Tax=Deinococcus ruber TaxID=1848197 RepID=A0A918CPI9_9DEIO|nr:cupin domain-containing protein [Deinococcus ruber]GGR32145.1 hypothetical protein GCM10008957_48460 [Deinococcus ruber]
MEKLSVHQDVRQFSTVPSSVGLLHFAAGTLLPETQHTQNEISFIHSGVLKAVSGGQEYLLRAGDVTLIPAGERHSAEVLEDVSLSYVLLEPQ